MYQRFLYYAAGISKYFLLNLIRAVKIVPLKVRYSIVNVFAVAAFIVCKKKRDSVQQNLTAILNRKPLLLEIAQVFIEYGRYWAELFDVNDLWLKSERIIENPEFPPREAPFLGLTFHLGNFEIFGPALYQSLGKPFHVIAENLKPEFLAAYFKKCRSKHHITTILHDDKREIVRVIKEGNALGVVCDRMVGGNGIEARLFGRKTRLPLNIVSYAVQKKIPIFVAYCVREKKYLRVAFHKINSEGNTEDAIHQVIQIMENAISKYPLQWHTLSSI